jgi:hypothetical protein
VAALLAVGNVDDGAAHADSAATAQQEINRDNDRECIEKPFT